MERLRGLSLFSGIGGIDFALKKYVRTICYVEIEKFAQEILFKQMQSGNLDFAPILADVKNVEGFFDACDIIFGGFPCQDISVGGLGKGLEGERSGLFREIARLADEIRPQFIFLENVPAIRTRGLSEIIQTFSKMGYDNRWFCISARDIGANHKRERWFLLANARCAGLQRLDSAKISGQTRRLEIGPGFSKNVKKYSHHWAIEPDVGRLAHGIPNRVDRIKALGNAVVPQQVRIAFETLMGLI